MFQNPFSGCAIQPSNNRLSAHVWCQAVGNKKGPLIKGPLSLQISFVTRLARASSCNHFTVVSQLNRNAATLGKWRHKLLNLVYFCRFNNHGQRMSAVNHCFRVYSDPKSLRAFCGQPAEKHRTLGWVTSRTTFQIVPVSYYKQNREIFSLGQAWLLTSLSLIQKIGAEDEIRTRDILLGKEVLYH